MLPNRTLGNELVEAVGITTHAFGFAPPLSQDITKVTVLDERANEHTEGR